MIFEVPEGIVLNQGNGVEVHFGFPKSPLEHEKDIVNQNPAFVLDRMKELELSFWVKIATPEQPLRAPSGGCLDVITDSLGGVYIPMEQRDEITGIRAPGFQNPWLGYPDTLQECFDGTYIYREINQECFASRKFIPIIIGRKSTEVIYVWKEHTLIPENYLDGMYSTKTAEKLGLDLTRKETLKTEYGKLYNRYCIYHQGKRKIEIPDCSFTWWPTPDILLLRQVFLPVTIEEVLLYHENKRKIIIVAVEELKGKKFGDKIQCILMREEEGKRVSEWDGDRIFKPTSSLKGILNQIGIYPNSWIEESKQLLSLKEYHQLWEKDPNRDPFTIENILWEKGKHP